VLSELVRFQIVLAKFFILKKKMSLIVSHATIIVRPAPTYSRVSPVKEYKDTLLPNANVLKGFMTLELFKIANNVLVIVLHASVQKRVQNVKEMTPWQEI
jgi:hypothetical protein